MQDYSYKLNSNRNKAVANNPGKRVIENNAGIQLQDNRPQSVIQRKLVDAMGGDEGWPVVQQRPERIKPFKHRKGKMNNEPATTARGDVSTVTQRVVLTGLRDKFEEEVDTEYMVTVHNYIIEALSENNEAAIGLLLGKVKELDPGKLEEINQLIRTIRIVNSARQQHLANVATAPRDAGTKVAKPEEPLGESELKEKESESAVGKRISKDLIVQFSASSREKENGIYFETAQKNDATSMQSRDAEVSLLQKIDNWLVQQKELLKDKTVEIFIRISKGPCTSCRGLINLFQKRNPGIRIVIEYQQAAPLLKEKTAKDLSQDPLSYGYEDAITLSKGNQYKVLPEKPVQAPQRVKGYSAETLNNLFLSFKEGSKSVHDFVSGLSRVIVAKDEDRLLLQTWLTQKVLFENSHSVSPGDMDRINTITRPSVGRDVQAHATVVLKNRGT